MSQLALDVPRPARGADRFRLACGHDALGERETTPRLVDGWYAALLCADCRRKVAVVYVAFGAPSDPLARLERPDEGGLS